jgi:hypothetical protein
MTLNVPSLIRIFGVNSEADLRAWLRGVWEPPSALTWTEAAHGGTQGAPDLTIALSSGLYMPTELKCLHKLKREGWSMVLRPPQCRYHELSHKNGRRSLFLGGWCGIPGAVVFALPGHAWPGNRRIKTWWDRLVRVDGQAAIEALLTDRSFWRV